MIVVDTSALAAVLFKEEEAARIARILVEEEVAIGAPTRFELLMVATGRKGEAGTAQARALLDRIEMRTVEWDEKLSEIALQAFVRFGKGRDRAGLNFGDCMAYAVAKSLDAPLLFKGDDFAQTDIRIAS